MFRLNVHILSRKTAEIEVLSHLIEKFDFIVAIVIRVFTAMRARNRMLSHSLNFFSIFT